MEASGIGLRWEPLTLDLPQPTVRSTILVRPRLIDALGEQLVGRWPATRRVFVIADARVWQLYGARVLDALNGAGLRAEVTGVPAGEGSKSLAEAARLFEWLAGHRAERGEPILAVGGGVAGDLAGFVAATYLRGVPLAQLPTTLLAMVDSSVGGKTAVNLPAGKNLVGAFYQPALVLVDPALLGTLPERELRSGWAEVIKYGWLDRSVPGYDAAPLAPLLSERGAELRALRELLCSEVIRACIAIKAAVVAQDEREEGLRRILNLGHTIGHAIEATAGYGRYTHGEAVALGLRGVGRLAGRLGLQDISQKHELERLLTAFGLPERIEGCGVGELLDRIGSDKKVRGGRVHWVLPRGTGRVEVRADVPEELVREVLEELGAG